VSSRAVGPNRGAPKTKARWWSPSATLILLRIQPLRPLDIVRPLRTLHTVIALGHTFDSRQSVSTRAESDSDYSVRACIIFPDAPGHFFHERALATVAPLSNATRHQARGSIPVSEALSLTLRGPLSLSPRLSLTQNFDLRTLMADWFP